MARKRAQSEDSDDYPQETQFVSQSDDESNLWEVLEILDERGMARRGEYLVNWKGTDPETGKPWPPSWTAKEGCTQGLIDDWKERKKLGLAVPGVEGKKLRDQERKNKRKRDEQPASGKGKKVKTEFAVEMPARNRKSRGRDATISPSMSPDFPEPADFSISAAGPSTRTGYRDASGSTDATGSHPPSSSARPVRRVRIQSREVIDLLSSDEPEEDVSPPPKRGRERPKKTASPTTRPKKTVIDLASATNAGPGPSTAASRSKESTPTKTLKSRLAPVPVPSPSVIKPHLKGASDPTSTQTTGSNLDSQVDPIRQFSSSPPRSQLPRTEAKSLLIESSDPSNNQTQTVDIDQQPEKLDRTRSPRKIISRINEDGDEVHYAVSSDDEESQHNTSAEVPDPQQPSAEINDDDDDLDELNSEVADEGVQEEDVGGEGTREKSKSLDPHQCLWGDCTEVVENPEDLAKHVRAHADDIHRPTEDNPSRPPAKSPTPPRRSPTPPPVDPEPHTDTVELAQAREKILELEAQLEEAKNAQPATQPKLESAARHEILPDPDANVEELKAEIKRLERTRKNLTADNNFLRQQYAEASDRAVTEVRAANELREQVKTLRTQLTVGLKQRSMFGESVAKEREAEARKLRGQVKILVDQSRKTDDAVRMKAAFYDQYKEEYDTLVGQLSNKDRQIDNLKERNEALVDQIETLRAIQMGVIPDNEESDASDDATDRSDSPLGAMTMAEIPSSRLGMFGSQADLSVRTPSNILSETSGIIETVREEPGFVCAWRRGTEECHVVCDTVEELHEHGTSHARSELLQAQGL